MRIILLSLFLFVNSGFAQYHSKIFDSDISELSIFKLNLKKTEWPVLDKSAEATIYNLDFNIIDSQNIKVRAEILITNQENTALHELFFHLYPNLLGGKLLIEDLIVSGKKLDYLVLDSGMTLFVALDQAFEPKQKLLIEINYQLIVPQNFSRNYGLFTYLNDIMSIGHGYPILAVYDNDGWHNETPPEYGDIVYADTSFFHVRITAPKELTVVSTGSPVFDLLKNDRRQVEIVAGPVRDFFFSTSSKYKYFEDNYNHSKIRSYYLVEDEGDFAQSAKEIAKKILSYAKKGMQVFEESIGPYPYKSLNYVPIETSALGIEFPSIIVMTLDFYEREQSLRYLESTTIHELAHQWFYGIIGNDQLNQPWLDESMAQYATLMYFGKAHGPRARGKFRNSLVNRWNKELLVIGQAVADFNSSQYYSVIYGRGPLLIEELAGYLGRIKFDEFLKEYYKREKFGISSSLIFKDIAEDVCNCELDNFFNDNIFPSK